MSLLVRMVLLLVLIFSVPGLFFVWFIPLEVFQSWMIDRADSDPFSQYAAQEQATALVVFLRVMFSLSSVLTIISFYYCTGMVRFLSNCWQAVSEQTTIMCEGKNSTRRTILFRILLVAWFCIALVHFSGGIGRRIEDWPWYHFYSGPEILPNISSSNRDVIRFLEEVTDDNARILILSDQKLFFLSYYLLPRQLFHPIHPESEFVIPKEHQKRQLAAYRLSDLDADYISRISPDYILEYYEGSEYLEEERVLEDQRWLQFLQSKYGNHYQPGYNVRLHKISPGPLNTSLLKPEQVVVP